MLMQKQGEPQTFFRARKVAWEAYKASSLQDFHPGASLGGETSIREKTLPSGCVTLPFSRAFSMYGAVLSKTFAEDVRVEKDPLHLFSLATHNDGFFIYIPPGVHVDSLSLVHAIKEKETAVLARVHVVLGKGAELTLNESFEYGKTPLCMTLMTCEVEAGAKLSVHSFAEDAKDLITSYRAILKSHASFTLTTMQEAHLSKSAVRCALQGKNSFFSFTDFSYAASGSISERFSSVDHFASESESCKYLKKIVAEGGISQYTGKITLHKGASFSQAKQMHRALTLGENAVCRAAPIFDIFEGEAQADHGSAIASFDEELLFYARSRGLGVDDAKKCMLQAFCADILKSFPGPTREKLEKRLA